MIDRIHPDAEEELYQAAIWYEEQEAGVGLRLLAEFDDARKRIADRAGRLPLLETMPFDRDIRRTFLKRFPFMVVCELFSAEDVILAVAHAGRKPCYWSDRRPRSGGFQPPIK